MQDLKQHYIMAEFELFAIPEDSIPENPSLIDQAHSLRQVHKKGAPSGAPPSHRIVVRAKDY
jgi:hypothetical protein